MDTPGKILKAEREKQGKSLKEISVSLKLSNDYLTAIEEDNYSELPAEVFTKAYLRLYADDLRLDGDYILGLFHDLAKDDVSDEAALSEKRAKYSPLNIIKYLFNAVSALVIKIKSSMKIIPDSLKKLRDYFNFNLGSLKRIKPSVKLDFTFIKRAVPIMTVRKSLLVAAAVIGATLITIMISDSDKPVPDKPLAADKQAPDKPLIADKQAADKPLIADKQIVSEKISAGDKKEIRPPEETKVYSEIKKKQDEEKISGKLVLKIIAEELSWASVSIDGGEYRESLLHAGESMTVRAEEKFNLKIGNAGGTKLVLNGKELGTLGPHGKVVNIKLP